MALRKFRTGQQTYNVATYVGTYGTIFYDEEERILRVSDGVTPGGFPVTPTTLVSTTEPTVAAQGQMWYNPTTFELWAYYNGNFRPTIDLATEDKIGGVKLGPGVITNGQGQIIIDSTGLDFSFGDFSATTEPGVDSTMSAVLSSINTNEPIVIRSNGTGSVSVVGEFNIFSADGSIGDRDPIFTVSSDGQTKIIVPSTDPTTGAVEIIGSNSGASQSTVNTGVMLHITGNNGDASRLYNDGIGSFAAFVARRYNGLATAPTAVLANEEIMRLSGTAHNGTSIPGTGNQRIVYRALGNQTLTNQGGSIELWTVPINTTTLAKVAAVDSTGITLESGKVFTGNLTGTADVATTVALVATNTTNAAHYLTFVDSATGNENVRTDTDLTYNPSTNTLSTGTVSATTGTFTGFSGIWTRNVRDAGSVGGTTVTLNFNTDAMVHCTFTDNFTVAFSNYTAGRTITLIATNTSGFDTDIITAGISAVNMQGDATLTVTQQTTAIITYYCIGTDVNSVHASAVYA